MKKNENLNSLIIITLGLVISLMLPAGNFKIMVIILTTFYIIYEFLGFLKLRR